MANEEEPSCYFLWGARMTQKDKLEKMVDEVKALTKTYLDGAGIFAWRPTLNNDAYELVPVERRTCLTECRPSTICLIGSRVEFGSD